MNSAKYLVPKGMDFESLAQACTAMLLGGGAFENQKRPDGSYIHGPWLKIPGRPSEGYQLDRSNDYWLHPGEKDTRSFFLSYRYPGQKDVVDAMIAFLKARLELKEA